MTATTDARGEDYRWRLWRRSFGYALLPPKPTLERQQAALAALGDALWQGEVRPLFEAALPALFAADAPTAERRTARTYSGVAATWYSLGRGLHFVHGTDPAGAHAAGLCAMWWGMAAAATDKMLDREPEAAAACARRLSPERLRAALPEDPDTPEDAVPHADEAPCPDWLWFPARLVDLGLAALRLRYRAAAPTAHRDRVRFEIVTTIERMLQAELASTTLRFDDAHDLDAVDAELRAVNTLAVWLAAHGGLLASAPPDEQRLAALRRITALIGDAVWILDALSDAEDDLEAGVWSLAWTAHAREDDAVRSALVNGDRTSALAALEAGPVLDRLLGQLEVDLLAIEQEPNAPTEITTELAALARLLVWSFLAQPLPSPVAAADAEPPPVPPAVTEANP